MLGSVLIRFFAVALIVAAAIVTVGLYSAWGSLLVVFILPPLMLPLAVILDRSITREWGVLLYVPLCFAIWTVGLWPISYVRALDGLFEYSLVLSGGLTAGAFLVATKLLVLPRLSWQVAIRGVVAGSIAILPLSLAPTDSAGGETMTILSACIALWILAIGLIINHDLRNAVVSDVGRSETE